MNVDLTENFKGFLEEGIRRLPEIATIIIVLVILTFLIKFIFFRVEKYVIKKTSEKAKSPAEYEKRISTLMDVFGKFIKVILWTIGFMLILSSMGVNIGPILTAAGVFGLAISFGAQSLVKDLINGIFILMENQVRVNDVAIINGTGGLVESINLRTIILRDLAGIVHVFPNGSINTLSNLTKSFSAYVFDIGVAYKENTDRVIEVMRKVADELQADEEYGPKIIEPVEIFGVDRFADSAVIIKGRIKTEPLQQWAVGREFNGRIKKAFDRNGIEIPFPHTSFYFGSESKPIEILMKKAADDTDRDDL